MGLRGEPYHSVPYPRSQPKPGPVVWRRVTAWPPITRPNPLDLSRSSGMPLRSTWLSGCRRDSRPAADTATILQSMSCRSGVPSISAVGAAHRDQLRGVGIKMMEMTGPRYWTCYWREKYWFVNEEYAPVESAGGSFRRRGVSGGDVMYVISQRAGQLLLGGRMTAWRNSAESETNPYRPRFPARGRRRAAKTASRLRTTTLPDAAFARYTATFRPAPVADGKTTLSIPSEIQMAANSWEAECPRIRRQSRTTFASSDGSLAAKSRFRRS